jgi:hypothetical protein
MVFLLWIKNKAWPWIKAHPWKALLFPLTLLAFILGAVFRGRPEPPKPGPIVVPPKPDIAGSEERHEKAEEALHQKAETLLAGASEAQKKEYERIKKEGTPEGVAKWIDQF